LPKRLFDFGEDNANAGALNQAGSGAELVTKEDGWFGTQKMQKSRLINGGSDDDFKSNS
jgi:hypothetical protein